MSSRRLLAALLALVAPKRITAADEPTAVRVTTLDAEAILDAIAEVETGHEWWRVGRAGERGRCQFMHTTWVRYTPADFATCASKDSDLTRRVELAHLNHLLRVLFQPGQLPEPLLIAAAWRHGERGAVKNVRGDYAARVANLYWDFVRRKTEARR